MERNSKEPVTPAAQDSEPPARPCRITWEIGNHEPPPAQPALIEQEDVSDVN